MTRPLPNGIPIVEYTPEQKAMAFSLTKEDAKTLIATDDYATWRNFYVLINTLIAEGHKTNIRMLQFVFSTVPEHWCKRWCTEKKYGRLLDPF